MPTYLYFSQKQLPESIARALYDNYTRLHFAQQLFLWEVYINIKRLKQIYTVVRHKYSAVTNSLFPSNRKF